MCITTKTTSTLLNHLSYRSGAGAVSSPGGKMNFRVQAKSGMFTVSEFHSITVNELTVSAKVCSIGLHHSHKGSDLTIGLLCEQKIGMPHRTKNI